MRTGVVSSHGFATCSLRLRAGAALILGAGALTVWACAVPAQNGVTSGDLAFVNVNVVPMDQERILQDQTVIVDNGRVTAIGPSAQVSVPEGAERIEGRGRYLMPGLAEMHAHVPAGQAAGNDAVERTMFLYVANGITTIRSMLGHPDHLVLRDRIARHEILGPRLYTSGPSLSGSSVPDPDTARRVVREQKEAGYDLLKIHPGIGREAYDAVVETAREVGITWAGHVPAAVGVRGALEAGQITIDHLDGYMEALVPEDAPGRPADPGFFGFNLVELADESQIPALAAETRKAGVWNVPTQSLFVDWAGGDPERLRDRPDLRYMPPPTVSNWLERVRSFQQDPAYSPERARRFLELRTKILRALHQEGADLMLGSDAPQVFNVPGFSIHQELETLIEAGLTPYEALATGTRDVARYFDAEGEYGTVAEGKAADLILLEANPLESIANVQRRAGVVVRGRWLPETEIQQQLNAIATALVTETN